MDALPNRQLGNSLSNGRRGHQVPGQRSFLPLFLGRGTHAVRAADEAFAFFRR